MVIGGIGDGVEDRLSPVIINIGEEGFASVEKCGNRKGFSQVDPGNYYAKVIGSSPLLLRGNILRKGI